MGVSWGSVVYMGVELGKCCTMHATPVSRGRGSQRRCGWGWGTTRGREGEAGELGLGCMHGAELQCCMPQFAVLRWWKNGNILVGKASDPFHACPKCLPVATPPYGACRIGQRLTRRRQLWPMLSHCNFLEGIESLSSTVSLLLAALSLTCLRSCLRSHLTVLEVSSLQLQLNSSF